MKDLTFTKSERGKERIYRIVYIEYFNGYPHQAITETDNDGYCDYWNIEKHPVNGDMMFFNSGGGGKITEIHPPHAAFKKSNATYYMHSRASFRKGKEAINITQIAEPLKLSKQECNPFNIGIEVYKLTYCSKCGGCVPDHLCDDHMYMNDNGDVRWNGNNKLVAN